MSLSPTPSRLTLLWPAGLLAGLVACSDFSTTPRVSYDITETQEYRVQGTRIAGPQDYDLTTHPDYQKVQDKVKRVTLNSLRYEVLENNGQAGTVALWMGEYGSDSLRKVAEASVPAAPDTQGPRDVAFTDQAYAEDLVNTHRRFRAQLKGAFSGVDCRVRITYSIHVETQ